jgi:hypothetical protein
MHTSYASGVKKWGLRDKIRTFLEKPSLSEDLESNGRAVGKGLYGIVTVENTAVPSSSSSRRK